MALVKTSKKACAVNPLKMSQPIGGALAFMGVSGCMPFCTARRVAPPSDSCFSCAISAKPFRCKPPR